MASSREFLDFVLEQLSELDGISYRAMMGEFIIYYKGKVSTFITFIMTLPQIFF